MIYNWQQEDWTAFKYDTQNIEGITYDFMERIGRISGFMKGLSNAVQTETMIDMMVSEAIKTSAIEGEYISREDVMSSIRNNLGLVKEIAQVKDKKAAGMGELMIDVRNSYSEALTKEKLFSWHKMLMKGSSGIKKGEWRSGQESMQIVSGAVGKEKIHFEAPPSANVADEMMHFIEWFNATALGGIKEIKMPMLRSAIAHLYFESIHPFEDGNGRIGRAIAEKALSQDIKRPILLSLSNTIEANKKDYYNALKIAQRSNEITPWINYFVKIILEAQVQAEQQIEFTLKKARFFEHFDGQFNNRQQKVIQRMLKEGLKGFEGGMNAKKYISIVGISKATATRDLQDLVKRNILIPMGGGRSTSYEINLNFK